MQTIAYRTDDISDYNTYHKVVRCGTEGILGWLDIVARKTLRSRIKSMSLQGKDQAYETNK